MLNKNRRSKATTRTSNKAKANNNGGSTGIREPLGQHLTRSTANLFIVCSARIHVSDSKAKILYQKHLMESRKKKFGVDYMNLVRNNEAYEMERDECITACIADLNAIKENIKDLEAYIRRVKKEAKAKIVPSPLKTSAISFTAVGEAGPDSTSRASSPSQDFLPVTLPAEGASFAHQVPAAVARIVGPAPLSTAEAAPKLAESLKDDYSNNIDTEAPVIVAVTGYDNNTAEDDSASKSMHK